MGCNSQRVDITTPSNGTPRYTSTSTATSHSTDQQTQPVLSSTPEKAVEEGSIDTEVQKSKELLFAPCLPINGHFKVEMTIPQDLFVIRANQPSIFDLNTNREMELTPLGKSGAYMNYFVSPDGKWVAYQDFEPDDHILVVPINDWRENQNQSFYRWTHPLPFNLERWFDSTNLLVSRLSPIKTDSTADIVSVILNPFTQEEQEFNLIDYPNYKKFKSGGVGNYMFGQSNLLPAPSLNLVVYPEVTEDMYYITLWDRTKHQAIVKLDFFYEDISNDPMWSKNGDDFIIQNVSLSEEEGIEWFQVTMEGDVRQITHFSRFIRNSFLLKASRSWNGQYLAFQWDYPVGEAPENRSSKYFVIDLQEPTLEGFCIDAEPFSGGELYGPVWSADNRYVAISNSSNGIGNIILVDMLERQAYLLGKDIIARGWVVRP
jgi:hypothetical protein